MQDYTAESIKSLEGFDIAWVDGAQVLSARSLPVCKPGSEIWFGSNPRCKSDAVDEFFRQKKPGDAIVIMANYPDRCRCEQQRPQCDHARAHSSQTLECFCDDTIR